MTVDPPAKILTIDDDAVICESFAALLEDHGYDVLMAENGRVGLELFRREKPDAILVDLRMPEVSGLEVLEAVHRESPDTPLVVISGMGTFTDAIEALHRGAWDYLLKPLTDMEVLHHTVQKALERSRLIQENRRYQRDLKERVRARTAELEAANKALSREIAERRSAERAAWHSEARYRILFETSADGILICDVETRRLVYANPAVCRLLGYPEAELIRLGIENIHPPESLQDVISAYDRSAAGHVPFISDVPCLRRDGSIVYVDISGANCMIGGRNCNVGFFRDITDRKKTEKELQEYRTHLEDLVAERTASLRESNDHLQQEIIERKRMERELRDAKEAAESATRFKSEFLANMSHEIRTPMTAILGFADSLLDSELSEEERVRAVQTICRNGAHLQQIIDDVLDTSKIEAGRVEIERISCSPVEIIAEIQALTKNRAVDKKLGFRVEFDGPLPARILSDPTRLRQILANLISNAIKFTDKGRVRLVTRLVEQPEAEPLIEFDVEDSGIGMSDAQIARLFRPFTQADASMTRKFGGTGLGLTISKRLAQMLGGDICVLESRENIGTRFRATVATGPLEGVPMIEDPASAAAVCMDTHRAAADSDLPSLSGHRILLAEDGPDNQRLIVHILQKAGAVVAVAENGEVAVRMALAAHFRRRSDDPAPYDVILMDMQMPIMDGYEATQTLRKQGYERPIIALTAHAMEADRGRCLSAGCDDYTTKPVNRRELIEAIVRQSSLRREQAPDAVTILAGPAESPSSTVSR